MSDDADKTDERTAGEINGVLSQLRKQRGLVPSGLCYHCDEPVDEKRLFCDVACREDYDSRQRLKAIAGRG